MSKLKGVSKIEPLEYLIDEENVGMAILECLQNNDPEGVMERSEHSEDLTWDLPNGCLPRSKARI